MNFRIKENAPTAWIAARFLGYKTMAIVIGKTIYLHGASVKTFQSDSKWMKHELKHIEQFKRYGFIRFIFFYLSESIRHGYINNRFEIECREAENQD